MRVTTSSAMKIGMNAAKSSIVSGYSFNGVFIEYCDIFYSHLAPLLRLLDLTQVPMSTKSGGGLVSLFPCRSFSLYGVSKHA